MSMVPCICINLFLKYLAALTKLVSKWLNLLYIVGTSALRGVSGTDLAWMQTLNLFTIERMVLFAERIENCLSDK